MNAKEFISIAYSPSNPRRFQWFDRSRIKILTNSPPSSTEYGARLATLRLALASLEPAGNTFSGVCCYRSAEMITAQSRVKLDSALRGMDHFRVPLTAHHCTACAMRTEYGVEDNGVLRANLSIIRSRLSFRGLPKISMLDALASGRAWVDRF
ncbi:hypothetical protein BJX99DRAFT_163134 [Aspergillus californicus]